MKLALYLFISILLTLEVSSKVISTTANNGNLILEDIPSIPEEIKNDLRKFQNVRSGSFRGFDSSG